jgi:uncharacterized protein (DUF58 family)
MVVPKSRLLFWFGLIVLPLCLAGAAQPTAATLCLAGILAFLFIALLDALIAPRGLKGISVALPPVNRMSKDRPAKLEVRIRNERLKPRTLRLALGLPPALISPQEEADVSLPADAEWSRLGWECVPNHRGCYPLRQALVEVGSPLGFWGWQRALPIQSEVRVYPNLFTERRNLSALFLRRGSFGLHAQRQVGKGREFEKLREYLPGDSFEDIHWKATARRGHPITKVFQVERTQEIYVLIDASRLSAREASRPAAGRVRLQPTGRVSLSPRPTAGPSSILDRAGAEPTDPSLSTTILERFMTAGLVLGLAAEQQGDLFGLMAFSNQVDKFVRARNGKAHYSVCRDALYTLQPRDVTPDFDEVGTFLRLRLRRRALLFFLTSLDDAALAEGFLRNVDLVCRHHLVVVGMLQPPGITPLFSNPKLSSVDEIYEHLGGHLLWSKLRELEKVLRRRGVHFALLQNERLSAELVSHYLAIKQRQLL